MIRKIETTHPAQSLPVATRKLAEKSSDLRDWLAAQAKKDGLVYLLAHADDGVIWGRWTEAGGLVTSYEAVKAHPEAQAVCPALRRETLLQARLFGERAELRLWRVGKDSFQARLIRDVLEASEAAVWTESFEESQRLLGTDATALADDFTLLEDGAQGLCHAVPLSGLPLRIDEDDPPRLHVRHYLAPGPFARVAAFRLVGLTAKGAS